MFFKMFFYNGINELVCGLYVLLVFIVISFIGVICSLNIWNSVFVSVEWLKYVNNNRKLFDN